MCSMFLGNVVSPLGISPSTDKCQAINHFNRPKAVKQVRSFCGLAGFYRRYIHTFGEIAKPLYALTKMNATFKWDDTCQFSFDNLKNALYSDMVLSYPIYSNYRCHRQRKKYIITTEKEMLAVIW